MQKNLYYRAIARRENMFKLLLLSFFNFFSSYARLLLEVFTRKNFGERYFRLSSALTIGFILALLPSVVIKIENYFNAGSLQSIRRAIEGGEPAESSSLLPDYLGWYLFLAGFILVSIRHYKDKKHNPSVFNFAKYSLYRGDINPIFLNFQIPGIQTNIRLVECLIEPAPFFIAGIFLYLIGQTLGVLLIFCSVCYALSYVSDYIYGDNFIMDKIDEIICNEELEEAFVNDVQGDKARGFQFRGQKPTSEEMRRKVLPLMTEDEEIMVAT